MASWLAILAMEEAGGFLLASALPGLRAVDLGWRRSPPSTGLTGIRTLQPPAKPMKKVAIAVRASAGSGRRRVTRATVMLSPVWMPIGRSSRCCRDDHHVVVLVRAAAPARIPSSPAAPCQSTASDGVDRVPFFKSLSNSAGPSRRPHRRRSRCSWRASPAESRSSAPPSPSRKLRRSCWAPWARDLLLTWRKRSRPSVTSMASVSTSIMRTPYCFQMPSFSPLDGQVQRGLAAHRGQHRVDILCCFRICSMRLEGVNGNRYTLLAVTGSASR